MAAQRVIWATSQHWHSDNRVSSHHYARLLAEAGWRVMYLGHPVSPLHLLRSRSRHGTRQRWREWRAGGETDIDGRLRHYTPMTLLPPHASPLLRSRAVLNRWQHWARPCVLEYLKRQGFDRADLVVVDSERYGFLFDAIPATLRVLRLVDCLAGFKTTARSWVDHERELIPRADHVVVTSRLLMDDARAAGAKRVTFVPNGVEFDRFAGGNPAPPPEYASIPSPRAVYVGAVEHWFDDGLLARAAAALPKVSFIVIGGGDNTLHESSRQPNVHVLGPRPYASVPSYLHHADVGIIPFRVDALTRTVNPIKLYEYMACGLPVVSTDWEELELLGSPAALCRSAEEFSAAIRGAIERPPDRSALTSFARAADWHNRAHMMMEALGMQSIL
ncbi:MAG: glycosyltransferase [Planctomycetes bacterium]|nr:glycosyltransferase [Planctomycetota bacterium]